MRLLILNVGQPDESVFPLRIGATIVGRDEDSGVYIPNLSLSRRHARFDVTEQAVQVTDLTSKNGTFVNNTPIETRTLVSGDKVRCGQVIFTFLDDATLRSPEQPTIPPPSMPRDPIRSLEPSDNTDDRALLRSGLVRFFPSSTVARMMDEPGHLGVLDVDVTALVADVGGFSRGESEPDARTVISMLNEFFPVVSEIIARHEGMLERYGKDATLAVFGVPFARPADADRALDAAIDLQRASISIDRGWRERLGRPFSIHVGLGSGRALAGNIGSASHVQYAAVGETISMASSISRAAGPGEILLCGETARRLQRAISVTAADDVQQVSGPTGPIAVHRAAWGTPANA